MRYGLLNDLRPNKHVFQYMVERYVALAYSKATMLDAVKLENCPKPALQIDPKNQQQARANLKLLIQGQSLVYVRVQNLGQQSAGRTLITHKLRSSPLKMAIRFGCLVQLKIEKSAGLFALNCLKSKLIYVLT